MFLRVHTWGKGLDAVEGDIEELETCKSPERCPRHLKVSDVEALSSLEKLFIKSLCKKTFPQKYVNSFFILVLIKDKFCAGIYLCQTAS